MNLRRQIAPYRDVIVFAVVLLLSNALWKVCVDGDEDTGVVYWLGIDATRPFALLAEHLASSVWRCVHLFNEHVHYLPPFTIRFDSGSGVRIVWSCTAIKQSFIWLCIMLATPSVAPETPWRITRRAWLSKAWYIPFGWLCCYGVNWLRILFITICMEHHPEWFEVLHTYVLKYAFYAVLFGIWLVWVEHIRDKNQSPEKP